MSTAISLFWAVLVFCGMVFTPEGYGWPIVAAFATFAFVSTVIEWEKIRRKKSK